MTHSPEKKSRVNAVLIGLTAIISIVVFVIFTTHLLHPALSTSKVFESDFSGINLLDSWRRQSTPASGPGQYLIGTGKADITGPIVEINFMGYANPSQIGTGLRQRIYARSFIVADPANEADRFVYMVLDTQSGDTAVRYGVISALAAMGPEYAMYGQQNIAVTGTHSHSGPGAWLNYLLPQVTSEGLDPQSLQAIVDGAVLSIQRAHESLTLGTLGFGTTTVDDANINRSPYAYTANPAAERAQYTADVDKNLTMLRFTRSSDGKDIGVLTWFPTHGTSMLGNNTYVSGDNKGVAADMFEKSVASSVAPGFVAGFSQANVGDTTPNVLGAYCEDGTNVMCTYEESLCSGKNENCHGRGPFFRKKDNGAASCYEIGRRQFAAAQSLYQNWETEKTDITQGSVRAYHTFNQMENHTFVLDNGTTVSTCAAALGYSFAAGTSDWPGAFDFTQGDSGKPDASPIWLAVRAAIRQPSPQQMKCQAPKPILLDVGEMHTPYDWAPNIVDIQMFRVGQMFFIISPGEATTMTGRRWKNAVSQAVTSKGILKNSSQTPIVVLGGPSNSYTHYIATEEEYGIQRYEGASTLYGQFTAAAYIDLSRKYLSYLADTLPSTALNSGPYPPNNSNRSLNFNTGVVFDSPGFGHSFGDVLSNTYPSTLSLSNSSTLPIVNVTFVGADPRNNLRLEGNYATIEMLNPSTSTWSTVRNDSDWDLFLTWTRTSTPLGTSSTTLSWDIDSVVTGPQGGRPQAGQYRLRYFGTAKSLVGGTLTEFQGVSAPLTLTT